MELSLGPICAFLSSATWAIGSTGYSRLAKDYSPFSINFTRALIALPLFILSAIYVSGGWMAAVESYSQLQWTHFGWFFLSMVGSYCLGDTFFMWSTRSLGVPGALAIASCYPVWTMFTNWFFFDEKILPFQAIGVTLAVAGIVVVVMNGPEAKNKSKTQKFSYTGLILALLTSACWATNSFATARGGADVIAPVGNTIRMIAALVLTAGMGRIMAPQQSIVLPKKTLTRCLWFFIIEAFLGSYFYIYGMSHSSLPVASVLASLAPVLSVPVALMLGFERFCVYRTIGVCLAVVGIWFLIGPFQF